MGMEVVLPGGDWPWEKIRAAMLAVDPAGVLKMADGLLVFPDEEPQPDWKELRVGFSAGMITLRREPQALRLITWGQIPGELVAARDAFQAKLAAST